MKNQIENQTAVNTTACHASTFAYLAAGLGIGAVVSMFFAPKSGEETRKWLANKGLNAIETANKEVREARMQVKEFMDQGQEKICQAVAAGREAINEPTVVAN